MALANAEIVDIIKRDSIRGTPAAPFV